MRDLIALMSVGLFAFALLFCLAGQVQDAEAHARSVAADARPERCVEVWHQRLGEIQPHEECAPAEPFNVAAQSAAPSGSGSYAYPIVPPSVSAP